MLLHCFHLYKKAFNPSAAFVSNLWNCNVLGTLPDSPYLASVFSTAQKLSRSMQLNWKEKGMSPM